MNKPHILISPMHALSSWEDQVIESPSKQYAPLGI